jgi:hypothetical protein
LVQFFDKGLGGSNVEIGNEDVDTSFWLEPFFWDREELSHPFRESIWATALPIPLAPPVMKADFPNSDIAGADEIEKIRCKEGK